jgi:hypothetical protein
MRVTGYWLGSNIWASTEYILSTKSIKQGCAKFFVLPTILSVKLVTPPAIYFCNLGLKGMSVTLTRNKKNFVTFIKINF